MATSGNDCVKVAVRVRPLVATEVGSGCRNIIEKTPGVPQLLVTGGVQGGINGKTNDVYTFNNVFMPEDSQTKVYDEAVKPMIENLFQGYNVTILAYGQTGSGKTFSMGTTFNGCFDSGVGVIPRAMKDIFSNVHDLRNNYKCTISCSFMELYQEVLYDLLSDKGREESACDIREDTVKGIMIPGLTEIPIHNAHEGTNCLIRGSEGRATGATAMNAQSSRSHAIFTVTVTMDKLGEDESSTSAKFHLVDLAGSERSKKTKATGQRFKEGVKINQGLLALGNVISALGGGQATGGFISYRDSKLTRLLQDSLGGNSVTLMIACISPADYNLEETVSTLRYADRAKKIKNKPIVNQNSQTAEIKRLNEIIQVLRMKVLQNGGSALQSQQHHLGEGSESTFCAASNQNDLNEQLRRVKLEKAENEEKLRSMKKQFSQMLEEMSECNYKYIITDSCNNELVELADGIRKLLDEACPAEFVQPDTKIFEQIRNLIDLMHSKVNEYKEQFEREFGSINSCDSVRDLLGDDIHAEKKSGDFTLRQIAFQEQLRDLNRNMAIKQSLLDRKHKNALMYTMHEDSDKTIIEYESIIKSLETQIEELRTAQNTKSKDQKSTKIAEERRVRIKALELELAENKKKAVQFEKNKKILEQDKKRIEDLGIEIREMKQSKVKLVRESRLDTENYKKWLITREKEISTLKEKGRKFENEMKRKERLHEKQQAVLRRKVEEGKAVNKRLQDVLDKSKSVLAQRNKTNSNRADVIQTWLDHELELIFSTVDAQISLKGLMADRAMLFERLGNLKATVQKTPKIELDIKALMEDLDIRNAQISDMQQKVLSMDVDAKVKALPDNLNSMAELKIGLKYILVALITQRSDFTEVKMKAEDLKSTYEASEDRVEELQIKTVELEAKFKVEKNEIEQNYEEKLEMLMRSQKTASDNTEQENPYNNEVLNQLKTQRKTIDEQRSEIELLHTKIAQLEMGNTKVLRPKMVTTYEEYSDEEDSEGSEFNFDDSFNDPEWKTSPLKIRRYGRSQTTSQLLKNSVINGIEAGGLLGDISEASTSGRSNKRSNSFAVNCKCKGSCATKQCGCVKEGSFCSSSCKCTNACVNTEQQQSKENEDDDGASAVVADLDVTPPAAKKNRVDLKNVTTPYYPYDKKSREPLLNVKQI